MPFTRVFFYHARGHPRPSKVNALLTRDERRSSSRLQDCCLTHRARTRVVVESLAALDSFDEGD